MGKGLISFASYLDNCWLLWSAQQWATAVHQAGSCPRAGLALCHVRDGRRAAPLSRQKLQPIKDRGFVPKRREGVTYLRKARYGSATRATSAHGTGVNGTAKQRATRVCGGISSYSACRDMGTPAASSS